MTADVKPLTGRKVFAIAAGAFATIIAANLTLAYSAIESFPGVEVKNGYIASQSFESERRAQERLGWRTEAVYAAGVLRLAVHTRDGAPAPISDVSFRFGRPTTKAADLKLNRDPNGAGWRAKLDLAPGLWRLDIVGAAPSGERFRRHLTFEAPK